MTSGDSILTRWEVAQAAMTKCCEAQDYQQAIQKLQEIVQDPEFKDAQAWLRSNVHYGLGSVYARVGDRLQALASLRQAVDCGFEGFAKLLADHSWDAMRDDAEFISLADIVQSRGDYVMLLRKYAEYDESEMNDQVFFTYQPASDPNLARVREELDLDTVAGDGDELSRLLRLLDWAHNIVRHDGNSTNPEPLNALSLIAVCREQNRGVNCRMMATILNEAYLAMGFCSRMVTCLPLSENDPDCHVINAVYAPSLQQWLYMDPTFGAYLADEHGRLLSISEVRARLITGEPLVLNKEANYNGQPHDPERYLHYMSKNLAVTVCATSSEFGLESKPWEERTYMYIMLAPTTLQINQHILDHGSVNHGGICHNPVLFWQPPV